MADMWWDSTYRDPFTSGAGAFYGSAESADWNTLPDLSPFTGPVAEQSMPPVPTPPEVPPQQLPPEPAPPAAPVYDMQPPQPVLAEPPPPPEVLDFVADDEAYDEIQWSRDFGVEPTQAPPEPMEAEPEDMGAFDPWQEPLPPVGPQPGETEEASEFVAAKVGRKGQVFTRGRALPDEEELPAEPEPDLRTKELNAYLTASPQERQAEWDKILRGPQGKDYIGDLDPDMVIYDEQGNPSDYLEAGDEKPGKSMAVLAARQEAAQAELDLAQSRLSQAIQDYEDDDKVEALKTAVSVARANMTIADSHMTDTESAEEDAKPALGREQLAASIKATQKLQAAQTARADFLEANVGSQEAASIESAYASTQATADRASAAMEAARQRVATARTQQQYNTAVAAYRKAEIAQRAAQQRLEQIDMTADTKLAGGRSQDRLQAAELRKSAQSNAQRLDGLMKEYKAVSKLDTFSSFLQGTQWLRDAATQHAADAASQRAFLSVVSEQLRPGLAQELAPPGEGPPIGPKATVVVDVPLRMENTGERSDWDIMAESLPFVGGMVNSRAMGKRTVTAEMPNTLDPRPAEVALQAAAERTARWVERFGVPVQKWTPEQRSTAINSMRQEILSDAHVQAAWDRLQQRASTIVLERASKAVDDEINTNIGELTGLLKWPVQVAGTALTMLDTATNESTQLSHPEVLAEIMNSYNAAETRTAAAEGREPILKTMADFSADSHFLAGLGRRMQNWDATGFAGKWLSDARTASALVAKTPEERASQAAGEEFGAVIGSMALTPAATGLVLKAAGFGRLAGAAKGLSYAERVGSGVTEATTFSALEAARTGKGETFVENEMAVVPLVLGLGALGELGRQVKLASLVQRAGGGAVSAAQRLGNVGANVANADWAKAATQRFASEEAAVDLARIKAAFSRMSTNAIPPGVITEATLNKAVAGLSDEVLAAVADATGTLRKTPAGKARNIDWLRKDIVANAAGDAMLGPKIVQAYNLSLAGGSLQEVRAALGKSPILKHKWLSDPTLEPWERDAFITTQNAAADLYANTEVPGLAKAFDTLVHYTAPLARAIENKARSQYGRAIPTAKMITAGYQDAGTITNARVAVYRQAMAEAFIDTGLINKTGGFDIGSMKRVVRAVEGRDLTTLGPAERAAAERLITLNREMFLDTAEAGVGVKTETGIRQTQMDPERYIPMRPLPEVYRDIKAGGKKASARVDEMMATAVDAKGRPLFVGDAGRAKVEGIFASMKSAPSIADWMNSPKGGGLFAREFGAWPEQMRDFNLPRVYSRQAEYIGREVGMAKAFGADRTKLKDLLDTTQKAMTPEAGVVWRQFVDDYLVGPMDGKVKGYNRGESLFGQMSQAEYLTKIGLNPHVALAQLAQPWISSVGAVGLKRTTAAALQTLLGAFTKSNDWALIKTSGAVTRGIMDLAADLSYQVEGAAAHNVWARTKYAIGRPFQASDAWARYVAGTAGHGKAQDAIRFLRGDYSFFERAYKQAYGDTPLFDTPKAQKQVREWLGRWVGLKETEIEAIVKRTNGNGKWAGFTPDESRKIIGRFVEQTNFRGDILSLPYWARSSPLAKLVTMFGSFGYQQSILAGQSVAEGFRKGPRGVVPSLAGTAVGLYGAGSYMTAVENMLAGKDEQTQTTAAKLIERFTASSFAGMVGSLGNKAKHGLTFPVASDLLALKESIAGAFDAAYEGDSVTTVIGQLLDSHIPLVRHSKGIADTAAWAYEAVTGKQTERLDSRAYADALSLYSHTRAVERATDPISAIVADLSDNRVGSGKLYQAYAERNRDRLREYLDSKLEEKGGDTRKLSDSLAASIAAASPVLRMLQMKAPDAVALEQRTPGLRDKQGRAVRHYLNYAAWVRDETLLWAHANAEKYGWDAARISQPGGPLTVHQGPINRGDFSNSPFFQTMPKTWAALSGDAPDSWVVPMNNAQFKGPITDELMDEIQALDAWERYIPPGAVKKMFRLPAMQKYREPVNPTTGTLSDKEP
ncbi:MAG: hypothetical protein M0R06_08900 [Sphaerochaeta sp.]|jgi:hypothetical protein|nr:hypothetical protein [Sphaerochaeta sp.]